MPKTTKNEVKAVEAQVVKPSIAPVMTEKAYAAEASRIYVFTVPRAMSKAAIAREVAGEYKVTVKSVRTLLRKGKPTRFSRGKHAYPGTTYRQDRKLAYVTVAEGDHIPVFDEMKAQAGITDEKADQKASKADKKAEKAEAKAKKADAKAKASEDKKATKSAKGDK